MSSAFQHINYIEEGKRDYLYEWQASREHKRVHILYNLKIYAITKGIVLEFLRLFNIVVAINLILSCVFTYLCLRFKFYALPIFIILPQLITLPVNFLINNDFNRREALLGSMSEFRGQIYYIFLLCKAWKTKGDVSENIVKGIYNKMLQIIFHTKEYLIEEDVKNIDKISNIVFQDLNDLSELIENFHNPKVKVNFHFMNRFRQNIFRLIQAFEMIRRFKEYASPISARTFTKFFSFLAPIIFSPVNAYYGRLISSSGNWAPYVFAVCESIVYVFMQCLEDRLFSPFVILSNDDINLDSLIDWINIALENLRFRDYIDLAGRTNIFSDEQSDFLNTANRFFSMKDNDKESVISDNSKTITEYFDKLLDTATVTATVTDDLQDLQNHESTEGGEPMIHVKNLKRVPTNSKFIITKLARPSRVVSSYTKGGMNSSLYAKISRGAKLESDVVFQTAATEETEKIKTKKAYYENEFKNLAKKKNKK